MTREPTSSTGGRQITLCEARNIAMGILAETEQRLEAERLAEARSCLDPFEDEPPAGMDGDRRMTRKVRTTPHNADLVQWASRPENQPPQTWWDEDDDPFTPTGKDDRGSGTASPSADPKPGTPSVQSLPHSASDGDLPVHLGVPLDMIRGGQGKAASEVWYSAAAIIVSGLVAVTLVIGAVLLS